MGVHPGAHFCQSHPYKHLFLIKLIKLTIYACGQAIACIKRNMEVSTKWITSYEYLKLFRNLER